MKRFFTELIGGVALLALGIILSASNSRVVFVGLVVAGAVGIGTAFVNLYRYKKTGAGRFEVKRVYPTDRPRELEAFLATFADQPPLEKRKEISLSCERADQEGPVRLNGEEIGRLKKDSYFEFTVDRRNNVVQISDAYEGILFFHVTSPEGRGRLTAGMGVQSAALRLDETTGIAEGIALGEKQARVPGEKKKMKKGVKIALGIVGALALAVLGLFVYQKVHQSADEINREKLSAYLADLDMENAEQVAQKIRGGSSLMILTETRKFAEALDAGDWQGAARIWEKAPGGRIVTGGRAEAAYNDCRWKRIEADVAAAVQAEDWAAAWKLTGQFYWDIYPAGAATSRTLDAFTEYFPEDAALWREAFDQSGAALFEAGDTDALEGFLKLYANTQPHFREKRFSDFSWYDAAEARWRQH